MNKKLVAFLVSLSCVHPMWGAAGTNLLEMAEEAVSDLDSPETLTIEQSRVGDARLYVHHLLGENRWKQFLAYFLLLASLAEWCGCSLSARDYQLKLHLLVPLNIMIVYFANLLTLPQVEDPAQDTRIKNLWESTPAILVAFRTFFMWRCLAQASSRFSKFVRFVPFCAPLAYPLVKGYFPPSQRYIWEGDMKAALTSRQAIRFGVGLLSYAIARLIHGFSAKNDVYVEDDGNGHRYACSEMSDSKPFKDIIKSYSLNMPGYNTLLDEETWMPYNRNKEKAKGIINQNSMALIFLLSGYLGCCLYDTLSDASDYKKVAAEIREATEVREADLVIKIE